MLRSTKEWDVRCPRALARMFPVRRGYYYKVDREQARKIVRILAKAYGINPPIVRPGPPERGCNGQYFEGQIWVHARAHMKSVFHEFYHHLDDETCGKYRSDDRKGGSSSLAWQFADLMFESLRMQRI